MEKPGSVFVTNISKLQKFVLMSVLFLFWESEADAGRPFNRKVVCPVGGEEFNHVGTTSYSIWGYRLDGKPIGSWNFPLAIPVCPSNGLPIYRDFSEAQLSAIKTIIASKEWHEVRIGHASYYKVAWIERKLPAGSFMNVANALLKASWQVDFASAPDGEKDFYLTRKRQYLREFVDEVMSLNLPANNLSLIVLRGRAANALRELRSFEEADSVIANTAIDTLDVVVPEPVLPDGETDERFAINIKEIEIAQNKRSWIQYFNILKDLIAQRNSAQEPLEYASDRRAADLCLDMSTSERVKHAVCQREKVKSWMGVFQRD